MTYSECLVYPGEYVPRDEIQDRIALMRSRRRKLEAELQVNMKEYPHTFCMEIALPGVERDEILLFVHDDMLTIDVLHQEQKNQEAISQLHEFDMDGRERNIVLPENADMEFVSAEFRKGVLTLMIPKAIFPPQRHSRQIIVY
jgi:HSP20 family protein